MADDEHTPAETPRARASSVSLSTYELFVAELEMDHLLPALSDDSRRRVAERLREYVRVRVHAVRELEIREHRKLRDEIARLTIALDVARKAAVRNG